MRFAAIADIHGNLPALETVLADIAHRGIDTIVNLGDLLSGPLWPAETADLLEPLRLPTVRGNHERQLLTLHRDAMGPTDRFTNAAISASHREWLATLPTTLWFTPTVFLCHGTPHDDLTYFLHDVGPDGVHEASTEAIAVRARVDAHLILCGHTHVAGAVHLPNGPFIVNPGSVGLPAYTDDAPHPHAMEAGTPHARYAILTSTGDHWNAELIALEYDWESAAAQAARHHRPDWAHALRTGLAS